MELNYFKDKLFDILNETDDLDISDISADDRNDRFLIYLADGSVFEVECRESGTE